MNDRPYASNSFLSVAMGRIFNTAMSGRRKAPESILERARKGVRSVTAARLEAAHRAANRLGINTFTRGMIRRAMAG